VRCEHSSGEVQRILSDIFRSCIGPIIMGWHIIVFFTESTHVCYHSFDLSCSIEYKAMMMLFFFCLIISFFSTPCKSTPLQM
jgi:hypothetical protein